MALPTILYTGKYQSEAGIKKIIKQCFQQMLRFVSLSQPSALQVQLPQLLMPPQHET